MVNLDTIVISKDIRAAPRGSLLYDCVEKIAYRLHLDHPERKADTNWFDAQGYLGCWAETYIRHYNLQFSFVSDLVQACLDTGQRAEGRHSDLRYGFAEKVVEEIESPSSPLFAAA